MVARWNVQQAHEARPALTLFHVSTAGANGACRRPSPAAEAHGRLRVGWWFAGRGLQWLEALINGGYLGVGGRRDLSPLKHSYVALLAIVERQSKYIAERHERALGGACFGCLDAVLDGLAEGHQA